MLQSLLTPDWDSMCDELRSDAKQYPMPFKTHAERVIDRFVGQQPPSSVPEFGCRMFQQNAASAVISAIGRLIETATKVPADAGRLAAISDRLSTIDLPRTKQELAVVLTCARAAENEAESASLESLAAKK